MFFDTLILVDPERLYVEYLFSSWVDFLKMQC